MVQFVFPAPRRIPLWSAVALKKLKILLFETTLLLFSSPSVVVPVAATPFTGAVAPSRISLLSIVLLLFPVTAVVVLKKISPPAAAEVFTPLICRNLRVSPEAPLIKRMVEPVPVFEIVRSRVAPVPPGRPSMVTKLDPFRSISAVVLTPVIESPDAPVAGLIVIVADGLPIVGGIAGNV